MTASADLGRGATPLNTLATTMGLAEFTSPGLGLVVEEAGLTGRLGRQTSVSALEALQSSSRSPAVVLVDVGIAALAVGLVSTSALSAVAGAGAFLIAGLAFGVWKRRTPVAAQGVLWYGIALAPCLLALYLDLLVQRGGNEAWESALAVGGTLLVLHVALWLVLSRARRRGRGLHPTLVIGPADRIEQISHRLSVFPESGLGFACSFNHDGERPPDGWGALVDYLLSTSAVEHVVFVADRADQALFEEVVRQSWGRVDCTVVPPMAGLHTSVLGARIGDLGVLTASLSSSRGTDIAKRAFDLVASVLLLAVLSPLLAVVALAVRLGDPGPSIFRQTRVGRDGNRFTLYKFRSMVVDAEARREELLHRNVSNGLLFKVHGDPRITRVGALIRRFSIDELPQLVNVLKGDMSLVGPRPLPLSPEEFDTPAQARHRVRPGLTGLWQVNGANAIPFPDMVDLDLSYVARHTMGLDLLLLARTVPALLIRRSAY